MNGVKWRKMKEKMDFELTDEVSQDAHAILAHHISEQVHMHRVTSDFRESLEFITHVHELWILCIPFELHPTAEVCGLFRSENSRGSEMADRTVIFFLCGGRRKERSSKQKG